MKNIKYTNTIKFSKKEIEILRIIITLDMTIPKLLGDLGYLDNVNISSSDIKIFLNDLRNVL